MQPSGGRWARLLLDASLLVRDVEGDCEGLLGIPARALTDSREPLKLLPAEIGKAISGSPAAPVLASCGGLLGVVEPGSGGTLSILFFKHDEPPETPGTVDDLAVGVVGVDPAGSVRLWNRLMAEIFHVARETALGSTLDAVLPQPVLFTWPNVLAAASEGRQVKVEIRPGQDRRVEAVFTTGGPGFLGTFSDTSDSFQTEKRLRTARRMNQTYLQTVRTGLVLFGPDYRLLVANKAFGDIFGLREVLLGMPIYEIIPSECFAELERSSRLLFEGDQSIPPMAISCRPRASGALVVVQTFKPVRSEDEESFLVVGVFDDISGQAKAESDLERSRSSQEQLFSLLASVSSASLPAGSAVIAEGLCRALGASASAIYLSQPYSTTRLTGTSGLWNTSLPFDFSDLHFPPLVWSAIPGSALSEHELGALRGIVEHCAVIPVGSGSANRGFLLAAFQDGEQASRAIQPAGMVADVLRLRADFLSQSSQLEQITYFLERHRRFLKEFVAAADIPAAVFGEDWRVVHWNRAMEIATGCAADTARKRTTMVMDMLFGHVGGVASARKLVRRFGTADAPAVWEIRKADGTTFSMAWRLFRADAAETDSMEAMTVLLGAPLAVDASSIQEVEATAERFDALNRGLIRLVASESLQRLAESVASVASAVAGAGSVYVDLDTPEGHVHASISQDDSIARDSEVWSVPLRAGSRSLGNITLEGGSSTPLVDDFARAVVKILQRLEESLLGERLDSLFRTGGGFFLCDRSGQVLLSGMRASQDGAAITAGANLVEAAMGDGDRLRLAFDTAIRLGRSAFLPTGAGGLVEPLVLTAVGSSRSDTLVIGMPMSAGPTPEFLHLDPASWSSASSNLLATLPSLAQSAREHLGGIARILGRDDPVRPAMAALNYDFAAISRSAALLHLISGATFGSPAICSAARLLDDLAASFVKDGRRPPNLRLDSELPSLYVDPGVLSEVFSLLAEMGGLGEVPEFAVKMGPSGAAFPSPGVVFTVAWKAPIANPSALAEAVKSPGNAGPGASAALAVVILALKLAGCTPVCSEDGRSLSIAVPAQRA